MDTEISSAEFSGNGIPKALMTRRERFIFEMVGQFLAHVGFVIQRPHRYGIEREEIIFQAILHPVKGGGGDHCAVIGTQIQRRIAYRQFAGLTDRETQGLIGADAPGQ